MSKGRNICKQFSLLQQYPVALMFQQVLAGTVLSHFPLTCGACKMKDLFEGVSQKC